MRCHGVGPTDAGRCAPPGDDGAICGASVDSLVTYTRQEAPAECKGFCNRRKCMPRVAQGDACTASVECAEGLACVNKKCAAAAAAVAALPKRTLDCRF
jgi:hypothetical protein